jgi:hypothetical protein
MSVEYGQSLIMEANAASHSSLAEKGKYGFTRQLSTGSLGSNLSESTPLMPSIRESPPSDPRKTLRFQVVVWYIGQIDMIQGRVPVTFRVTLFWNAPDEVDLDLDNDDYAPSVDNNHNHNHKRNVSSGDLSTASTSSKSVWKMHGRQEAFQKELKDQPLQTVDVPPVSILNVVTFETIGQPEVSMLNEGQKLMRWTCMYRATVIQDHWRVDDFPHDEHTLVLKLAVLAHRKRGERWDHNVYKLDLATRSDSQGSTRVPHGLVVDEVSIPEFRYSKEDGLNFQLDSLRHGPGESGRGGNKDQCLHVSLRIMRDSSYYDKNIMPLLALLNLVAVSIVIALPAEEAFQRGLLMLNIAFVEIGIRMTTDSRLPSVFYQIKMQRILNEYFAVLLLLVLESMFVFELYTYGVHYTGYIDTLAALTAFTHNAWTLIAYYGAAKRVRMEVLHMSSSHPHLDE